MSSLGRSRLGRGGGGSGRNFANPSHRSTPPATPSSSAARLPVVRLPNAGSAPPNLSDSWANENQENPTTDEGFSSHQDNQAPQFTIEDLLNDPERERTLPKLDPFPSENTLWFDRDELSKISKSVSNIIRSGYNDVYLSWTNTPPTVRDQFFVKFAQIWYWNPAITETVRLEFDQVGIDRMKGITTQIKRKKKCPKWMNGHVYANLCTHWATQKAKEKSEKTSKARYSDRDGCGPHKHVSGPKSYYRVQCELEREYNRPASISEVFIKTHTDVKTKTFVDQKAKKIAETYEEKKREFIQSQKDSNTDLSDAASETIELTPEQEDQIFLQSTLPDRRGNVYGLGNLGRKYGHGKKNNQYAQSTVTDTISSMQQEMASYKQEIATYKENVAMLTQQNQEILQYLRTALPTFPTNLSPMPPPPP